MNKKIFLTLIMSFIFTVNCLAQIVCYTTTSLNVRKGPSTKYQIIGTIPANTEVTISGENYKAFEWLQVTFNGQPGYINTKYLSTKKTENEKKIDNDNCSLNKKNSKSKDLYCIFSKRYATFPKNKIARV